MTAVRETITLRELVPLLFVEDIGSCVAFYVDTLGFRTEAKWEPDGTFAWCKLRRDGAAVMLQQACEEDGPAEARGRGVGLYFNCDDVDALFAEFTARGLKADAPRAAHYGQKQLYLRDPGGYSLCFQSTARQG